MVSESDKEGESESEGEIRRDRGKERANTWKNTGE